MPDAELLARLDLPTGVEAVEVPAGLLAEVIGSWPALRRTSAAPSSCPASR